ncbi:MAG: NAD(P)H-quinone oxidoreductase [Frankiaceae bacterium]
MLAVSVPSPGAAEVMSWSQAADPAPPGPGEVALDVAASAVNRADVLQRQGHYPPPRGASPILGLECSGTVAATGPGVTGWNVGDAVCALLSGGGYAERVVVPAGQLLPVPGGLSLVEAAGLPEAACTVWSNVFEVGRLADGEVLLAHGGAGGVGTMALQVARALRPAASIFTTAGSQAGRARCLELGADEAIDYRGADFVERVRAGTGGAGTDLILDIMGGNYLARNVDVLAADGRLVIIGLQGGRRAELDIAALLGKRGSVHATSLRHRPAAQKASIVAGVRAQVWPAIEAGTVRPVIDRVVPIAEVAQAHRAMEDGGLIGKIVLAVAA